MAGDGRRWPRTDLVLPQCCPRRPALSVANDRPGRRPLAMRRHASTVDGDCDGDEGRVAAYHGGLRARAPRRCALRLSERRLCRRYPLPPRPSVPAAAGRRKGAARPCGMGLRPTLPPTRRSRRGLVVEIGLGVPTRTAGRLVHGSGGLNGVDRSDEAVKVMLGPGAERNSSVSCGPSPGPPAQRGRCV